MRNEICAAYLAAGEMAVTMLQIAHFQDGRFTFSIGYAGDDDEGIEREREADAIAKFYLSRRQTGDELQRLRESLETQTQRLIPTFEPIADLLQFSHSGIQNFVLDGQSGRDLRWPLGEMGHKLLAWASQFQHCWRGRGSCVIGSEEYKRCRELKSYCPYNESIHAQVQERIYAEKSRLMRDCMPYLEFAGYAAEPVADQAGETERGRNTPRSNQGKNASGETTETDTFTKCKSFLLTHHKYGGGADELNQTPASPTMIQTAGVCSKSQATRFLKRWGGFKAYSQICDSPKRLEVELRLLAGEMPLAGIGLLIDDLTEATAKASNDVD